MENNTNGVKKMPTPAKVSKTNNDATGLSTQVQHTQRRLDSQEKNEFIDANLIILVGGDANAAHVLKTLIHLTNDRIAAGEQQSKIYLCYTLPHWQVLHFWFWSVDLVGRLFRKLVQFGLLKLSRDQVTKRNSYSVDFSQIQNLLNVRIHSSCNFASWISDNFGECQKNDVSYRNNSSCNFTSSKQVDGQDNDVSDRNDSSCKSASSKNEQKNPENAGEHADARVNNNYIYNIPPIPIPPNLLPLPTKGVDRGKNGVVAVRVGNQFKISPAETVDQIVASQPTPNQQDPIGKKNRSEDDKIKNEAVQILCAVNEARVSLQHLRPATDTGPLTYGYTDNDLQAIISLLQSHPEASLQNCLKVVNFRAEQIAKKPEYFRYLNASETWSVNWFCKTLDLVKKSKSNQIVISGKSSEIKSTPVVRRPDEYKTIDYESKKQQFSERDREETAAVIADYWKKREAKNEEDRKESAAAYWKTQEAKNGLGLISSLGIQVPAEILEEVR